MKILFMDFTLPYLINDSGDGVGGWAVELGAWLRGLGEIGHQAGVLTWKGATDYIEKEVNFDLLDTYDPDRGVKVLKYFYYYIPSMLRTARKYNPDIIIQATACLNTGIMAFIASRIGVPFVYRVANDTDVDERFKTRLRRYEQIAYRYGLSKASAILCQSHYQLNSLKKQYPTKSLYVLHNPFDNNRELPKLRPRSEKNYFAWVSLYSRQKNMPLLYVIAKALPHIEFRIAGRPIINVDEATVTALTNLKRLKNVNFIGYVKRENILDFFANAIGLLSTSYYEGFSNTFLEAFVSGTPVIAPLRIDPDHIISRNKLGLTSENDKDLPKLITQLHEMELAKYEELMQRCRSYVLTHHVPETKAKELIEILELVKSPHLVTRA